VASRSAERDLHRLAGPARGKGRLEGLLRVDRSGIDGNDLVSRADARALGRRAGLDASHAKAARPVVVLAGSDRAAVQPDPGRLDLAEFDQVADDPFSAVDRDRKANALRAADDRGRDTDHVPLDVDDGSARV